MHGVFARQLQTLGRVRFVVGLSIVIEEPRLSVQLAVIFCMKSKAAQGNHK
jgi:hypothetical protein